MPVASAVAMVGKQSGASASESCEFAALQTHVVSVVHVSSTVIAAQCIPSAVEYNAATPALRSVRKTASSIAFISHSSSTQAHSVLAVQVASVSNPSQVNQL